MGTQLNIPGDKLRAAGFKAEVDVEYGWDDNLQTETETEWPYWVAPDGTTIGSYAPDSLCIDWNAWGGNRARFTPLLQRYDLLQHATLS